MARRKRSSEGAAGAYWMDTYGDMITLVLTFFVLLFSFSTLDVAKWEALVANLSGSPMALISPLDPGGSISPEALGQNAGDEESEKAESDQMEKEFDELYMAALAFREVHELESLLIVERLEGTVVFRFMDSLLFDSGQADLRPESLALLQGLFSLFEENENLIKIVRVEGHTDTMPISNLRFRDNWDLSAIRASTVVRMLEEQTSIDPIKLSAAGYGEQRPIDTNDTEEGRARNRRVDIVIERREVDLTISSGFYEEGSPILERSLSERTQEHWDDYIN